MAIRKLSQDYSLPNVDEVEVLTRNCPRIHPWTTRALNSLFHPNMSSYALNRNRRKMALDIGSESTQSHCLECGREFFSETNNSEVRKVNTKLQLMPTPIKWEILTVMYDNVVAQKRFNWHLEKIREMIEEHSLICSVVDKWWIALRNEDSIVDRKTLIFVLSRMYDILVPCFLSNPVERMHSIQIDCQKLCGKAKSVTYDQLRSLLIELCDNFVSIDICGTCGSGRTEYNPLNLSAWGSAPRHFLHSNTNNDKANENKLSSGVEVTALLFSHFLKDLCMRVCTTDLQRKRRKSDHHDERKSSRGESRIAATNATMLQKAKSFDSWTVQSNRRSHPVSTTASLPSLLSLETRHLFGLKPQHHSKKTVVSSHDPPPKTFLKLPSINNN